MTLNQAYAENAQRQYPLVDSSSLPDLVVGLTISGLSGLTAADLTFIGYDVLATSTTWRVGVNGGPYDGWEIRGSINHVDVSPDFPAAQVRLIGWDGSANRPDVATGWMTIGRWVPPAPMVVSYNNPVDPQVVQPIPEEIKSVIRMANLPRAGASSFDPATPVVETISYQERTEEQTPVCYAFSVLPSTDQQEMQPDVVGDSTSPIPIPPLTETTVRYNDDQLVETDLRTDQLVGSVPDISGPAEVVAPGEIGPVLLEGRHCRFRGSVEDSRLVIQMKLMAGLPDDCSTLPGYVVPVTLDQTIRSINGVHARRLELEAGIGVDIFPSPGDSRIVLVINPENLNDAP